MSLLFDFLVIIYYIYILASAIFLILDNRRTASTFAWLFVFVAIPVIGVLAYIVFGKNHRIIGKKRKQIERTLINNFSDIIDEALIEHKKVKSEILSSKSCCDTEKLINMLEKNSYAFLTGNNDVEIIQEGERKFSALIEDLKNAKKFIHMAYFIWRDDELTKRIKDILIKKAGEGVEIRILIDALGSIGLSQGYKKELRSAGIQIYRYFDFRSFFTLHTINYRNHRKIVIIDGYIGYTGGMNMGQEYIDGDFGCDCWRDTHMRILGNGVGLLQGIFGLEWENTTGDKIFGAEYFPKIEHKFGEKKMQIAVSGPDSPWDSVKQVYFELICSAKKSIVVQTPYFIPDESLMDAMKAAALGGIDVKIMLTGVPDKKLPYWAAFTFFENLLEAGVKIYHYNKCFLHSKTIAVDSEMCSIGTANFDIRSFDINYELMVVLYDRDLTLQLEKDFVSDLQECSEMTQKLYDAIVTFDKFRNSAARLASPLL